MGSRNMNQETSAVDNSFISISLPGEINVGTETAANNLFETPLRQAAAAHANGQNGVTSPTAHQVIAQDLSDTTSLASINHDILLHTAKQHQASHACTIWDDRTSCYRWRSVFDTGPAQLGEFGTGIQMYFEFLRMLGVLFFILFLFSGPLLVLCRLGSFVDEDNALYKFIASFSVGNLGTCSSGGCQSWEESQSRLIQKGGTHQLRDWTWWLGLLDASAACLVLVFGAVLSHWWLPRQKRKAAGQHLTAGRFAVQVRGLPRRVPGHAGYKEKLKEHFEKILREEANTRLLKQPPQGGQGDAVCEVVLVRRYEGAIRKFGDLGQLLLKMECVEANIKRGHAGKQAVHLRKRKEALERRIIPLEQALQSQIELAEEERDVCGAYVMFRYEEYKDLILHKYRLSTSLLFRFCQKRKRCFFGKAIRVEQACEPSDLFWENMDCKSRWRLLRRMLTLVLTVVSLVLCALLILLCTFYSASRAAVPSQEVWVVKNAASSGIGCLQVCDWQLYKDLSCKEQHATSSLRMYDYTGEIAIRSDACTGQSVGSHAWQSASCQNEGEHAVHDWLSVKFDQSQTVQCMQLQQLQPSSLALEKLEVYACSAAVFPTSLANYSTWRPEDNCVAMKDIVPRAGQTEIRIRSMQHVSSLAFAVTPGDCTHPVNFDVARSAKTAAEQDHRVPESDSIVACFCTQKEREQGSLFRLPPFDTDEKLFCREWSNAKNFKLAKLIGSSMLVLILNYLLMLLINFLVYREKHSSATTLCVSQMMKLFCAIFVNTGFLTLLINANLRGKLDGLPILGAILFKGNFHDFDAGWFTAVGSSLVLTMALQIFSTTMPSLIWSFVVHPLQVCWYRKSVCTQQMMNQLYVLPEFEFALRMAQTMNVSFVTLMFSGGLPVLYLLATVYCIFSYWTDKWCLLHGSRKPPAYNETIFTLSARLFYIGSFLHVAISVLIFGNQIIFPSSWGNLQHLASKIVGMTVNEYNMVMQAYFVGTEASRDKLFNKYWQARFLELGRGANWLLFAMLAVFLAYFTLQIVWYWILRPLLGPFILTAGECFRKCAEKRIGTESRCLDSLDTVKEHKKEKGETHLMSYEMSQHPNYHDVHVAFVHAKSQVACRQRDSSCLARSS